MASFSLHIKLCETLLAELSRVAILQRLCFLDTMIRKCRHLILKPVIGLPSSSNT